MDSHQIIPLKKESNNHVWCEGKAEGLGVFVVAELSDQHGRSDLG